MIAVLVAAFFGFVAFMAAEHVWPTAQPFTRWLAAGITFLFWPLLLIAGLCYVVYRLFLRKKHEN